MPCRMFYRTLIIIICIITRRRQRQTATRGIIEIPRNLPPEIQFCRKRPGVQEKRCRRRRNRRRCMRARGRVAFYCRAPGRRHIHICIRRKLGGKWAFLLVNFIGEKTRVAVLSAHVTRRIYMQSTSPPARTCIYDADPVFPVFQSSV